MREPSWLAGVRGWALQHPLGAALVTWTIPVVLLVPVLLILAAVRDSATILAAGLPTLLGAPTVMAIILYVSLRQEREGQPPRR